MAEDKGLTTYRPEAAQPHSVVAMDVQQTLQLMKELATNKDVDAQKLEVIYNLMERQNKTRAEQEFNEAMRQVQQAMPKMTRDKANTHLTTKYSSLDRVNEIVVPIYTANGFSMSFSTADCPVPSHIRVTAVLAHIGGHSRSYQHDVALDLAGSQGKSNKTPTQAGGSSISYGRRYITAMAFNLIIEGEDKDGNSGKKKSGTKINVDQAIVMQDMLNELAGPSQAKRDEWKSRFLKRMKVDRLEDIDIDDYQDGIEELKAAQAQKK